MWDWRQDIIKDSWELMMEDKRAADKARRELQTLAGGPRSAGRLSEGARLRGEGPKDRFIGGWWYAQTELRDQMIVGFFMLLAKARANTASSLATRPCRFRSAFPQLRRRSMLWWRRSL